MADDSPQREKVFDYWLEGINHGILPATCDVRRHNTNIGSEVKYYAFIRHQLHKLKEFSFNSTPSQPVNRKNGKDEQVIPESKDFLKKAFDKVFNHPNAVRLLNYIKKSVAGNTKICGKILRKISV